MSTDYSGAIFTKSAKFRVLRLAKPGDKFFNPDGTFTEVSNNDSGNLYIAVPEGSPEILISIDKTVFDSLKLK